MNWKDKLRQFLQAAPEQVSGEQAFDSLIKNMQEYLDEHNVPLQVLPGADVRIEADMLARLNSGEVVSLADHRKHVLLELPHEIYVPLEGLVEQLERAGMVGILSHPERNQGILKEPELIRPLVERGCLMQVTAGSLMGTFGTRSADLSVDMLERNEVHFLATDAHGPKSRRPLLSRAFERAAELVGEDKAFEICCHNPAAVAEGRSVVITPPKSPSRGISRWLPWRRAA